MCSSDLNPVDADYRVNVESDSTVRADLTQKKEEMGEFLQGSAAFFQTAGPIIAQEPAAAEPLAEVYAASTRLFNLGKQAEDALDRFVRIAKEKAAQPKPPDPQAQQAQMDAQAKQAELSLKAQQGQDEHAIKQGELAVKNRELDIKTAELGIKQHEAMTARMKAEADAQLMAQKLGNDAQKTALDFEAKVRKDSQTAQ